MSLPNTNTKKDFVAIRIKNSSFSYPPNSKLFCNLCSCNLILLDAHKEEWYCSRCNVSYFPNKGERLKQANKFSTPGPLTDNHGNIIGDRRPLVAMIDNSAATNIKPKQSVFPRSFEGLRRPGVKITSFSSTVDNEAI
jgi:ribosomal protein S27AE